MGKLSKKNKTQTEDISHTLGIVASLFSNLASDSAARIRLLAKFVENTYEKTDKLLEIREQHPRLEHIYYDDPRGLRHYTNPGLLPYEELIRLGEGLLSVQPKFVDEEIEKGSPDDTEV